MAKTILITGASTGIGKATAAHFAKHGWNVVATMRQPADERDLAAENVLVTRLDVLDDASIASAVAEAEARFGGVDVLLNNAGYGAYGALEASSMEVVRRQFDVNLQGAKVLLEERFSLERDEAFLAAMRERFGIA